MRPLISRWPSFAASALTGVLWFAAGEPLGWGIVAWVAFVPLLVAVARERRWRWAWAYGLCCALVFFGLELWWIALFGWIAWVPLVVVLALYSSAAVFVAGVARRLPFAPVLVSGAWVGIELARDRWPFGGFAWGAVGTTQGSVPGVRWLAGTVGVYGLSFLIVFAAAVAVDRWVSGRWSWGSLILVGAALTLFVAVDVIRYAPDGDEGTTLEVAVVQGSVPRPVRPDQRASILGTHIELTRELPPVDLVIWPEDSIGVGVLASATERVAGLVREMQTPFIVGRSRVDDLSESFINTVEHLRPDGVVAGTYIKRHPVPFGEYVPLGFLRDVVGTLQSEIPYDQRPGDEVTLFDVDGTVIGTPICFESVFPRDIRDFTSAGAELIVVSTNNSSFERSYASQQHLAHTRMRALESRQTIVQAALAGITAVVRPDGSIDGQTGLFEKASYVTEVQVRPAASLYVRVGDLFPMAFAAGTGLALLLWAATTRFGRRR